MDLGTLIGLLLGIVLVVGSIMMGGSLGGFIDIPSVMITVGGTIAAILITFPLPKVKAVFGVTKKILNAGNLDVTPWYNTVIEIATIARRDGLLALEDRIPQISDPFLRRGLQMALDGTPPEAVKEIMELEIEMMEERHKVGHSIYKNMGGYAPAFGMIGTLIGLVNMLQSLDDPSKIGAGMAVALITTFYGALVANLICLPIQGKLEQRTAEEIRLKKMLLNAIISIQAGDSPRIVGEKLLVFLPPDQREKVQKTK